MTESERNQVIFQLNMMTGWSVNMLETLSDEELKRHYNDRIVNR